MKPILVTFLCALLTLSLVSNAQETAKVNTKAKNTGINKTSKTRANSMKGAYTMLAQKVSFNGKDSMLNVQQLKIYTDRHFMYAHAVPGDSLAVFGIGTYRVQNGMVIEYPLYTSEGGPVQDTFELTINKTADGYSQVMALPADGQGRQPVLTEDYQDASRNMRSPLDGAWKMTRLTIYPNEGSPIVINDPVQYKVYQSGNVMWANSFIDSTSQKRVSAFGYGTFTMNGPKQAVETISQSTYRTTLEGQSVTLQLEFKGKDRYLQTIAWPNGKQVEEYERLK